MLRFPKKIRFVLATRRFGSDIAYESGGEMQTVSKLGGELKALLTLMEQKNRDRKQEHGPRPLMSPTNWPSVKIQSTVVSAPSVEPYRLPWDSNNRKEIESTPWEMEDSYFSVSGEQQKPSFSNEAEDLDFGTILDEHLDISKEEKMDFGYFSKMLEGIRRRKPPVGPSLTPESCKAYVNQVHFEVSVETTLTSVMAKAFGYSSHDSEEALIEIIDEIEEQNGTEVMQIQIPADFILSGELLKLIPHSYLEHLATLLQVKVGKDTKRSVLERILAKHFAKMNGFKPFVRSKATKIVPSWSDSDDTELKSVVASIQLMHQETLELLRSVIPNLSSVAHDDSGFWECVSARIQDCKRTPVACRKRWLLLQQHAAFLNPTSTSPSQ